MKVRTVGCHFSSMAEQVAAASTLDVKASMKKHLDFKADTLTSYELSHYI